MSCLSVALVLYTFAFALYIAAFTAIVIESGVGIFAVAELY